MHSRKQNKYFGLFNAQPQVILDWLGRQGYTGQLSDSLVSYFQTQSGLTTGATLNDHINATLTKLGYTGTLNDKLNAFYVAQTNIAYAPDAERAFWNSSNTFQVGGGIDANTIAMLHFDGANGSTTITDSAPVPSVWTCQNGAVISTAASKFGGASLSNPAASSSWVDTPVDAKWDFTTGNFTFDTWINPTTLVAGNQSILSYGNPATGNDWMWFVTPAGELRFFAETASTVCDLTSSGASITTGTFQHFALVRNGASIAMYHNGNPLTLGGTPLGTTALPTGATALYIGARSSNNDSHFDANFDEFRISNVARWTTGFTPASAAYTV